MDDARHAARRAYERGRWRHAVARASLLLPTGVAAYLCGADTLSSMVTGGAVFAFATLGGWWRTDLGRGAIAGASTIAIPMLLSVVMTTAGAYMTPAACAALCLYGSATLGGVAGFALGQAAASRYASDGLWFAGAAASSAAFVGAVGCSALGFGSTFGLGFGLMLGGLPAFALTRSSILPMRSP